MMKEKTLEGRLKYKKEETMQLLKNNADYVGFDEELGFLYEFKAAIYGKLNRIVVALKNGHIKVHDMLEVKQ